MVTLDQQIDCVAREIKLRLRVYPRRVAAGQMSQPFAHEQIAHMEAVLRTLQDLRPSEIPKQEALI